MCLLLQTYVAVAKVAKPFCEFYVGSKVVHNWHKGVTSWIQGWLLMIMSHSASTDWVIIMPISVQIQ